MAEEPYARTINRVLLPLWALSFAAFLVWLLTLGVNL